VITTFLPRWGSEVDKLTMKVKLTHTQAHTHTPSVDVLPPAGDDGLRGKDGVSEVPLISQQRVAGQPSPDSSAGNLAQAGETSERCQGKVECGVIEGGIADLLLFPEH
jgi:hypothetical protein